MFWKKPQQKFSMLRKSIQKEIIVLTIIIALFIIIVPLVGVYNAQEGDRKAASVINNYVGGTTIPANFNGVIVSGYVSFVDTENYQYRLHLRFSPSGSYSGEVRNQATAQMMFKINGINSQLTEANDVIPVGDYLFPFSEGIIYNITY
jgi:hypothetical protein